MTTLNLETTNTDTAERELTTDELDSASGGFLWIVVVVAVVRRVLQ